MFCKLLLLSPPKVQLLLQHGAISYLLALILPLDKNVVKYVPTCFHHTISSMLSLPVLLKILSVIIMHCQRLSPHGAHTFHLFATPTSAAGWLAIKNDGHKLSKISIVFSEVSNLNFFLPLPSDQTCNTQKAVKFI